jgi:hypothetical protein
MDATSTALVVENRKLRDALAETTSLAERMREEVSRRVL